MKTKNDFILKIQPSDVKNILSENDITYTAEGNHKNILCFSSVVEFAQAGACLFNSGYVLCSQLKFSKKHNISKQLVHHWIRRDGRLIELSYDDGARISFVVDSVS